MKFLFANLEIECQEGDITKQPDMTAIVNAANAWLRSGGGVAGAIHRVAGPELAEECRKFAPLKTGEAVLTKGYKLPNRYVIHCLGPVYGRDKPEDKLLAACYENALRLAEEYKIDSLAFPAIATGYFGYPIEEAAEVAIKAILKMAPQLKSVKKIRFVLFTKKDLEVYQKVLNNLLNPKRYWATYL